MNGGCLYVYWVRRYLDRGWTCVPVLRPRTCNRLSLAAESLPTISKAPKNSLRCSLKLPPSEATPPNFELMKATRERVCRISEAIVGEDSGFAPVEVLVGGCWKVMASIIDWDIKIVEKRYVFSIPHNFSIVARDFGSGKTAS